MRLSGLIFVFLCFQSSLAQAEVSAEDAIKLSISSTFPELEITSVKKSQMTGLYEVLLGPDLVYASPDGRYIFQGDLIDLKKKRNLSEEKRASLRKEILKSIPAREYIEFAPEKKKHTVYVFTDIDCGYCRKLHRDMSDINRRGIAVRYLAFPRAGIGSKTSKQMEAVWCASNPAKAMNEAKQGMKVADKSCANPVSRHFALGQDIGVRGTPAIYTEDGQSLPGYMPPDKLLQALNGQ